MTPLRSLFAACALLVVLSPTDGRADLWGEYYCNYFIVDGVITPDPAFFSFSQVDPLIDNWAAVNCNWVWNGVPSCTDHYAVRWTGLLRIDVAGDYGFGTISDDGSQVFIDGVLVTDNVEEQWWDWEDNIAEGSFVGLYPEGYGGPDNLTGPLTLSQGFHTIDVRMFEARFWDGIELWWLTPGSGPSDIPYYGISCANGGLTVNTGTNWQIVPSDVLSLPPSAAPELPGAAGAAQLEPARPNPATDGTVLAFVLRNPSTVEFSVRDAAGRRVASLVSGRQAAGRHEVTWTGRDRAGRPLPSGVYFCCLEAEGGRALRKVTLLR